MGERFNRDYWMDAFFDPPEYQFITPRWGGVSDLIRVQDSFIVGIDPIDPITPKSEGDDLIFKTTPKYVL